MSRLIGNDLLRAAVSRAGELDRIRPYENGQLYSGSRGPGMGIAGGGIFAPVPRFATDPIESNTRHGTNPAPFVSKGHKLDANTIGLWRFDDARADNRNAAFQDSTGTPWTLVGHQGVCSYDPIKGQFARKFVQNRVGVLSDHTMITHATSASLQAMCYGSWTFEAYVRFDSISPSQVLWNMGGSTASELLAENTLALVYLNSATGWFSVLWETGAGVDTTVAQSAGTKPVAGVWYYVAMVKDSVGKTVSFYLDGALQQSVGYVNDPTGGTNGGIAVPGQNQVASGSDSGGDISVRHMQWSTIARTAPGWFEESNRRKTTHGIFQKDANVFFGLQFFDEPSAEDISGYGHHLISTASSTDGTAPVFSLIPDDEGAGRSFLNCTLATWYSEVIRSAILADFTAEVWVQIIGPVPATGNGIFHFGGDPSSETQPNNRHGMNITQSGLLVYTMESGAGANKNEGDVYTSPNSFDLGRRYHLALRKTMTGGTCTLAFFVDGVKAAESYLNTNADGSTQADKVVFQVGGGCGVLGDISKFFGFMDDFRLSNIARTDLEIQQSFDTGASVMSAPTVTVVSPTPGVQPGQPGGFSATWSIARLTPIVVDIDGEGLEYACVVARHPTDQGHVERCVYRRGKLRPGFAVRSTVQQVTATKLRISVLPDEGWPSFAAIAAIEFDGDAIAGGAISDLAASS